MTGVIPCVQAMSELAGRPVSRGRVGAGRAQGVGVGAGADLERDPEWRGAAAPGPGPRAVSQARLRHPW